MKYGARTSCWFKSSLVNGPEALLLLPPLRHPPAHLALGPTPTPSHPSLLPPPHPPQTATPSLGDARDDWKIARALSEVLGVTLPYASLAEVRARLAEVAPHLGRRDAVEAPLWLNGEYFKAFADRVEKKDKAGAEPLGTGVSEFYQTDAVSRASRTMAACVRARQNPIPGI